MLCTGNGVPDTDHQREVHQILPLRQMRPGAGSGTVMPQPRMVYISLRNLQTIQILISNKIFRQRNFLVIFIKGIFINYNR